MDIKHISLAVLSDIHCHALENPGDKRESYFVAGEPRIPGNRHPVQALLELVQENQMCADVILCPGDICNKTSRIGLSHAWDLLRTDIKSAFKADAVICTIGNHDVTSRSNSTDPFQLVKTFHPEFPFTAAVDNMQFWNSGFCLINVANKADILVLNTTYDHYNEEKALRGTFEHAQITALNNYLTKKSRSQIRIALLHHHPIVHSFVDHGSNDVLASGDQLLDVLSRHKFNLIVHGHRHQPRFVRQSMNGHDYHIFCAGAFSVFINSLIVSRARNLFHLINLEYNPKIAGMHGSIKTWEFHFGIGWLPASIRSTEFSHIIRFGIKPDANLVDRLVKFFEPKRVVYKKIEDLEEDFPCIVYLLPDEITSIQRQLAENKGLKVDIDEYGAVSGIGKLYSGK